MSVDRRSPVPLYQQVKEYLLAFIREHRGEATTVPSEVEISKRFGISRATARIAYQELVSEGLLDRVPGKGTFIRTRTRPLVLANWLSVEPMTREPFRGLLEGFRKTHPEAEVQDLGIPYEHLEHRLIFMASSGGAPDLSALVYLWIPQLAYQGALLPLDELYSTAMRTGFDRKSLQTVSYRGQLFAVDWVSAPNLLFYNRRIVGEYLGTDSPAADTYEELLEHFVRIHERSKGSIVPMSIPVVDDEILFLYSICNFLYAFDGGLISQEGEIIFNSVENIRAFTWLKGFVKAGHVDTAGGFRENRGRFAREQMAFLIEGPWLRRIAIELNPHRPGGLDSIGFSVLPKGPAGVSASVLWNHILAIFRQCRDPELALELVRYITTDPGACERYYLATGLLPAFRGVLSGNAVYSDPFGAVLQKQMESAIPIPTGHPQPVSFLFAVMLCAKASREILWGDAEVAATLNRYASLMKEFYRK
jgi:ABC-type glycerol-3-phosphate transport system substrate-binding protein